MKKRILNVIYSSLDQVNQDGDLESVLEKSPETLLMGHGSKLDSLGLVNVVVSVEENINENFNIEISLADERAMTQEESPFGNVNALAEYIEILINEELDG